MQVFVSHSDKDHEIAKELSSRLSSAGVRVWLADDEVMLGENWPLEVGKALQRSNAMVILLSPDAVESQTVRNQISFALSSSKFEGRVVPVIVRPTRKIPWFLQTLNPIRSRVSHKVFIKRMAEDIVESLTAACQGKHVADRILGKAEPGQPVGF